MEKDRLKMARLKVDRAEVHIAEAESQINAFLANYREVRRFVAKRSPDGQREFISMETQDVPAVISIAVGEAAYQLRSSLDVATVALAGINGHTALRQVAFPFAEGENDLLRGKAHQKISGLSAAAQDVIRSLRPYASGNRWLYGLNGLCNDDKHNKLIAVAAGRTVSNLMHMRPVSSDRFDPRQIVNQVLIMWVNQTTGAPNESFSVDVTGTGLMAPSILEMLNEHAEFHLTVSFDEGARFPLAPVMPTLHEIHDQVRTALQRLAETA
jgi:hypothetical protein